KTDYYGKANSVIVAPGATSVTVDCTPYYTTSLRYTYENHPNDEEDKLPRSAKMLWNDVSTDFVGQVALGADGKSFTAQLNGQPGNRSEEHTSELQSRENLVCRLLLEKKNQNRRR